MNADPPAPDARHRVLGAPLFPPFPEGMREAMFGMGCFWGAEKLFWRQSGVYTTMVGYAGGSVQEPTYAQVCTGRTGHAEVVRVVYDEGRVDFLDLLGVFWEGHDPTQYMRQGADVGTQYRSVVFYFDAAQKAGAERTAAAYAQDLRAAGHGEIVTEIAPAPAFYYAEAFHQQYLEANPGGYCGHGGAGVRLRLRA